MMWDGLFFPLMVEPVKHIVRLASEQEYRKYCLMATRMGHAARYHPRTVRVRGKELSVPDAASFLSAYREIFVEQSYRFDFPGNVPRILDLGANIGLSVVYFKSIFPQAMIRAYEADPAIFGHLEQNIMNNGFSDVELVHGAVWHEDGTLNFHTEGADGGRVLPVAGNGTIGVPAYDIRKILSSESFDVLKMDIEGAEHTVIPACRGLLKGVRYAFVEFHSSPGIPQQLHKVLDVLAEAGFHYYVESVHHVQSPLIARPVYGGYDMQLNIFAWREPPC